MELVIIHFQPVEFYPPIQNLLSVLKNSGMNIDVQVISTYQTKLDNFKVDDESITISRINVCSSNRIFRLTKYIYFYCASFYKLIRYRPSTVLYFESISAFPAILYMLIFKKKRIMVHYHEYTTKEEYSNGMQFVKLNYFLERRNYSKFSWISHTNEKRTQYFKDDNIGIADSVLHVMPNFPLSTWNSLTLNSVKKQGHLKHCIQLVYIGAVSFEDTYIRELIDFIKYQPEKYELEIFSFQLPEELKNTIYHGNIKNIKYSGPINYNDIPKALEDKDIGLILYKGNTLNYVYNAPNKLFEYLNCGLEVWFPKEMIGCYEYLSLDNPKVVMISFSNIKDSLIDYYFSRDSERTNAIKFTAEEACEELILNLNN